MTTNNRTENIVKELCEKSMEGTLKVDELIDMWPVEANSKPFLKIVYEDIEDGVEHIPGFFLKKGIDFKSWFVSNNYYCIYIDYILLTSNDANDTNDTELLNCREFVLKQNNLSKDFIKNKIGEYFKEHKI
jgi:hypothetical protein